VIIPELAWNPTFFDDPDGGEIVLWPYLPCVRMPAKLRPRKWDAVALITSLDEIEIIREEEIQDRQSPGIHVESANFSGTSLGMLIRDLRSLEIDGPYIPDPEILRLIRHAENARNGLPIYPVIPSLDDERWADWLSSSADEQVTLRNLLSTFRKSKRWEKRRNDAIGKVQKNPHVDASLGAASTVCAAWWLEEGAGLSDRLIVERTRRLCSRIRGALSNLRGMSQWDGKAEEPSLLVPVQQAQLPSLVAELHSNVEVEPIEPEGSLNSKWWEKNAG